MGKSDKLDRKDFLIIRALAEDDMKLCRVARRLNYSTSAVSYHIQKIIRLTGRDPRRTKDMLWFLDRLDGLKPVMEESWYV
jgi:sugar diacid utilization regulator